MTAVVLESEASFQVALVNLGFTGEELTNQRKRDVTHKPMTGVLSVGSTVKPKGPGFDVFSDLRHQGVAYNHFSPLSDLGSEMGLCFGERELHGGSR